ncbi:MAG: NAD(P)-binding domain-containing protein [Acidobacteriota bacterium]|nr:NAD(P)-binding domain-containing protein [Acidobacteriota bacterium]
MSQHHQDTGHSTTTLPELAKGVDMKIGILGNGQVGRAHAWRFTEAGRQARIANSRWPHSLADCARKGGPRR